MTLSFLSRSRPQRIGLQLIAMTMFFGSSCGLKPGATGLASCATGTAEIQVYDAGMRRVCGCAEASNVAFAPGQNLTCTVNVNTRLFVNFVGISSRQAQILVSLTPWATTVRSPAPGQVQTDVIYLNSTGTFTFLDPNVPNMTGTLIVN